MYERRRGVTQVVSAVRELDVRGLPGRAKQIVQTDNIAQELDGYIERLSLLVDGLTVCQPAMATNRSELFTICLPGARPKQCSPLRSLLKLVFLVIPLNILLTCDAILDRRSTLKFPN